MSIKLSHNTFVLRTTPSIKGFAGIVGKKEGEGPLAAHFDLINNDATMGETSWEKAESRLQKDAVNKALEKSELSTADIDVLFAGDLLNQCVGSSFGLRELNIPFLGLYGACSTMAEGLLLAGLFIDNYLADYAAAVTSSHFCSAERQFRFPLEYGGQRTPTAQWTVTGAGCSIVAKSDQPPYLKGCTIGKIQDLAIKDINNMGAAMAPAAAYTIKTYLQDTNTAPTDYDLIVTGDLGQVGTALLHELLAQEGINLGNRHKDCGLMIFDPESQDVHAGGSGCGCGASVLCSYLLTSVQKGTFADILFIGTGALMSPTTIQQGESIPAIAHLVHIGSTKQRSGVMQC